MAMVNVAPTKSNLLAIKSQLATAVEGYDLLEQKREILVMELMHMVEKVKLLEGDIEKVVASAYPALKDALMSEGGDKLEKNAENVKYNFDFKESGVTIGGMNFSTIEAVMPKQKLFSPFLGGSASQDKVQKEFFTLLKLLTEMASIRTIVWRLANEVKKTQRRVNALDKMVIPQSKETVKYIESVLEERERDNVFVLKSLKNRIK